MLVVELVSIVKLVFTVELTFILLELVFIVDAGYFRNPSPTPFKS